MTVLMILWVYFMVGIIVARMYGWKLCKDVRNGNQKALKLLAHRDVMGEWSFWTAFYLVTAMLYGLFVIRILIMKGVGDVEMRPDG